MTHIPTLLIVDDDAALRELLRTLLTGDGYRIEMAEGGEQALRLATEVLPDLILLDVMMPGMDGFEVCRRLRGNALVAEVPIIMVTALNDRASRLIGIEAGADDFIDKPFDTVELRARVRTIVRLNRFRHLIEERHRADVLEEEKQRLVYDLHDDLAQRVGSVHQQLQAFAHRHPPRSKQTQAELGAILELAQSATREIRQLITSLQPQIRENVGLATALRMQIEEYQAEGWDITFDDGLGGQRLSTNAEATLYKVAHEALTNVRKHAGTQRVALSLQRVGSSVRLEVRDWGRGFDLTIAANPRLSGGIGLRSMRSRMQLASGTLEICTQPGEGVKLVAELQA